MNILTIFNFYANIFNVVQMHRKEIRCRYFCQAEFEFEIIMKRLEEGEKNIEWGEKQAT